MDHIIQQALMQTTQGSVERSVHAFQDSGERLRSRSSSGRSRENLRDTFNATQGMMSSLTPIKSYKVGFKIKEKQRSPDNKRLSAVGDLASSMFSHRPLQPQVPRLGTKSSIKTLNKDLTPGSNQ